MDLRTSPINFLDTVESISLQKFNFKEVSRNSIYCIMET